VVPREYNHPKQVCKQRPASFSPVIRTAGGIPSKSIPNNLHILAPVILNTIARSSGRSNIMLA
jgi:hypothetical protein